MVTAADRAAATCQRWVRHKFKSERAEGVAGAIGKPPPRVRRREIPSPTSAEGGRPSAAADGGRYTSPPQQCTPQQKSLPSVSLAALTPFAEEAKVVPFHSINTKKRQPTAVVFSVPPRRMSAAALSAAVDSIKLIRNAPNFRRNQLCRRSQLERQPLFGREREGGERQP